MLRRTFWLLLILLSACGNAPRSAPILPTLAPSPTAAINLEEAQRAAITFLDAWQRQDFATMHSLISFASQEATPYEQFQRLYEDAQNLITLESFGYQPLSLARESDRVVVLSYDVRFQTIILGQFEDRQRVMRLIWDRNSSAWRVAWSMGDIFAEMGNGATLRFEASVPRRANIYDRDGVILADQNGVVVDVSLIAEDVADMAACLQALTEASKRPQEQIMARLSSAKANWVVNVATLEPQDYVTHQETLTRLCGASFSQRAIRQYPQGTLMPHILGNVGYPSNEEIPDLVRIGFNQETILGRSGIEASWDAVLRGQPGGRLSLIAPNGKRLRVLAEAQSIIPKSLWLTIDADLQAFIQRVFNRWYQQAADGWAKTSRGGAAVVLDVNTGEVLAMVSFPTYEGNALNPFPAIGRQAADLVLQALAEDPANPLLNRAAQGIYPSGSIMKVIDAVAVADSGVYPLDYSYVCTGVWQEGRDRRFDWLAGGHGRMTIASALTNSCNPFFYQTGLALDRVDPFLLPSYARRMGLGAPTGIRSIGESGGTIPDPDWIRVNRGVPWTFSHAVSMAIGQGEVEVTPLQMTRMYGAVANGGTLYRPLLVRETGLLDQRERVAQPDATSQFGVRADVMALVQKGLCDVTTATYGTASHIFRRSILQQIGVCGKTGTAQAPGLGASPHSWFMAWAPRDEPQIVVGVLVENAGDGSAVAAPITREIMEYYFFRDEELP
ncbi:MAG: penicillin-binding transpeptidase domain-containing protein [Anaerolineae bacterium]|nr:penicillin-binding transpeptidase domain-containing protein [Anaerolineae bacterium]MDW8171897.1 penicillin-binding transpeptidase domain-containing protein [Anaerolineae bacterium]